VQQIVAPPSISISMNGSDTIVNIKFIHGSYSGSPNIPPDWIFGDLWKSMA
jgi:hypothetical protein